MDRTTKKAKIFFMLFSKIKGANLKLKIILPKQKSQ